MTPAPAPFVPLADAPTEGRARPLTETRRAILAALLGAAIAIYAPPDSPTPPATPAPRPRPEA